MNIGRISDLISNETCYEMIRENRWPDDIVRCPHCDSDLIKKNGHDNVQIERKKKKKKKKKRKEKKVASQKVLEKAEPALQQPSVSGEQSPVKTPSPAENEKLQKKDTQKKKRIKKK